MNKTPYLRKDAVQIDSYFFFFQARIVEPNTHQIFNPSRYFVATEMSNSFKKLPRKSSELTREI